MADQFVIQFEAIKLNLLLKGFSGNQKHTLWNKEAFSHFGYS